MDPQQFTHPAGQVLKSSSDKTAYWTFFPHPLPPALSLDAELVRTLSAADRALGELAGLGRLLPNPHLLIGPFLRREAVLSSRIENTETDIADLYAYEAGQLSLPGLNLPPEKDVREVYNYVQALEYGLERINTLPVSLRLIREVHARLLEGVRGKERNPGEFRTSQNWIGGTTIDNATFVPPPADEMKEALYALENYLHGEEDYPPLIRLAFIHYQFETIHPFLDGNGRIGRLLLALLLVNWKLLPLPLLYLSAYLDRYRSDYFERLQAVRERSEWREWVMFFLQGVAEQARDTGLRAKRLQDLQEEWRQQLTKGRASTLPLRLVDRLFEIPILTIPQAQRLLEVTYVSAQRTVEKLVEAGILHPLSEQAYGRMFCAEAIIQVIGEE